MPCNRLRLGGNSYHGRPPLKAKAAPRGGTLGKREPPRRRCGQTMKRLSRLPDSRLPGPRLIAEPTRGSLGLPRARLQAVYGQPGRHCYNTETRIRTTLSCIGNLRVPGINGLVIEGNDIRPGGPGTDTKIFVDLLRGGSHQHWRPLRVPERLDPQQRHRRARHPHFRQAAANKCGEGQPQRRRAGADHQQCGAVVEDNENFAVTEEDMSMPEKRQPKK